MKKWLMGVLSVVTVMALCFCLMACNTTFVGTYKLKSMSMDMGGMSVNYEVGQEYMGVTINEDLITLTVNEDNTFELSINLFGADESVSGTWEEREGTYYLISSDGDEEEVKIDGKQITFVNEGVTCVLTK